VVDSQQIGRCLALGKFIEVARRYANTFQHASPGVLPVHVAAEHVEA